MAKETQLASLELGLDSRDFVGTCDAGYACAYSNTISWRTATTPLPMENDPRAIFERLFGDSGSTNPAARTASIQRNRSILDSVTEKAARLERDLGAHDRTRLNEYLEAVRDVERRIQKAEEQNASELPVVDQPAGVPATFEEHARLMFDLQALAFQCDLTRVITLMIGHEHSGMTFPQIGVPDAHHPISHHQQEPEKVAKMAKINAYHMQMFARLLKKLQDTPDGEGTLLDHVTMMYGMGMADSNSHSPVDLPMVLAGGGAGHLKGGRHIRFKNMPLANLHLTLLDQFGVHLDRIGDSTGRVDATMLAL
jgi:hypothetical protein